MNLQRKFHEEHKERRQRIAQAAKLRVVTTVTSMPAVIPASKVRWKIVYDRPLQHPSRPAWMDLFTPEVIREINHNDAFQASLRAKIIMEEVSLKHGVSRADMVSDRRQAKVVKARHEAMYLVKQHTPWSTPQIGRYFGGRDHTTVLHAVRKFEQNLRQGVLA